MTESCRPPQGFVLEIAVLCCPSGRLLGLPPQCLGAWPGALGAPYWSTRLTAQIGLILSVMLALRFVSGAFFFLYIFNYDAPPWFTPVRVVHFYVGIASIPFLLAK
jgi:hypothetical protein